MSGRDLTGGHASGPGSLWTTTGGGSRNTCVLDWGLDRGCPGLEMDFSNFTRKVEQGLPTLTTTTKAGETMGVTIQRDERDLTYTKC